MSDMKETIEGAEEILRKLWERRDEVALEQVRDAYAEAYGYLKQGVVSYMAARQGGVEDQLRAALDRANALIGESADEAKRLSDEVERLDALVVAYERRIENMTTPCPNHPRVRLAPDEGCAVCANST